MWWKKKHKKEEQSKEKDKWDINVPDAIKKYGSASKVMEEIFYDNPDWLRTSKTSNGLVNLIVLYLREEYYRKNPK